MAQDSKIQWTKHTCNLWWGCTKVHAGCDHCYAETSSKRWGHDIWGNDRPRKEIVSVWNDFVKYQKAAEKVGEIHRVFVGSMMDIFEKSMSLINSKGEDVALYQTGYLREVYFRDIVPRTPNLLHLMLTKRPSNINKYIPEFWKTDPPKNVMFGTSPCDQETYDNLWVHLAKVNGKRFLSIEPMLGEVSLNPYCPTCGKLVERTLSKRCKHCNGEVIRPDWVICGGESGHGKRPIDPDWARTLRDQCYMDEVPFFMKQIDKVQEIPEDLFIRQFP